jgi:hypothetical protein
MTRLTVSGPETREGFGGAAMKRVKKNGLRMNRRP